MLKVRSNTSSRECFELIRTICVTFAIEAKIAELGHLLKRKSADSDLLLDAYLCSAIIKGRYHYEMSTKHNLHLLQHPLREPLAGGFARDCDDFDISNTAGAVSNIVIGAALHQRSLDDRIKCWVNNVDSVRWPHSD